jgi:hypothetical protein
MCERTEVRRMTDTPAERRPQMLELMEELQRLEDDQRTLDLRDPSALEKHQRKIDALRERIKTLRAG